LSGKPATKTATKPATKPAVKPIIEQTAQQRAAELLAELVAGGMRWLVLAPGSRSQALALAAAQLEAAGELKVLVRIDERSAGFAALALSRATVSPVAIVVTSGTALANLHPAILEASHTGVPLIAITADRPIELQGVGANQTTDQLTIYGSAIRELIEMPADSKEKVTAAERALSVVNGPNPGPVQINFAAREPLSSATPDAAELLKKIKSSGRAEVLRQPVSASYLKARRPDWLTPKRVSISAKKLGVVIAGNGAGVEAAEFAEALNWPLLAEPGSGARHSANFVPRYAELLAGEHVQPLLADLKQIVVFGKLTLSRGVPWLLAQPGPEVTVVSTPGYGKFDVAHSANRFVLGADATGRADDGWLSRWRIATGRLAQSEALLSIPEQSRITRAEIVQTVMSMHGFTDALFVGASRVARDMDRHLRGSDRGLMLSRGLSGIDGSVSTLLGLGLAVHEQSSSTPATRVRALVGDVTAVHDIGGLNLTEVPEDLQARMHLVVVNDGGGTIFRGLELAERTQQEQLVRFFETPQRVNFAAVAAGFGWSWTSASTAGELQQALAQPGPLLIEVLLDEESF
jgi:2-succinyl-5-enolpyruvyl-6-hydroxy-3-cyclohexene-1-carboxylate synthase